MKTLESRLAFWIAEKDRLDLSLENAKAAIVEELDRLALEVCPYAPGTIFILSETEWPGDAEERRERRWRLMNICGSRPPAGKATLTSVDVYMRGVYLDPESFESGETQSVCLATLERMLAHGRARLLAQEEAS